MRKIGLTDFHAGLLRDWVMDGYRPSWNPATSFADYMLILFVLYLVQAFVNHLVVGSSPTRGAKKDISSQSVRKNRSGIFRLRIRYAGWMPVFLWLMSEDIIWGGDEPRVDLTPSLTPTGSIFKLVARSRMRNWCREMWCYSFFLLTGGKRCIYT